MKSKLVNCWYTISMTNERTNGLIHLCELDGKQTMCGKTLSKRWYIRNRRGFTSCAKCLKSLK